MFRNNITRPFINLFANYTNQYELMLHQFWTWRKSNFELCYIVCGKFYGPTKFMTLKTAQENYFLQRRIWIRNYCGYVLSLDLQKWEHVFRSPICYHHILLKLIGTSIFGAIILLVSLMAFLHLLLLRVLYFVLTLFICKIK